MLSKKISKSALWRALFSHKSTGNQKWLIYRKIANCAFDEKIKDIENISSADGDSIFIFEVW